MAREHLEASLSDDHDGSCMDSDADVQVGASYGMRTRIGGPRLDR